MSSSQLPIVAAHDAAPVRFSFAMPLQTSATVTVEKNGNYRAESEGEILE